MNGLNDSPKRWFLEVSNLVRNIGWRSPSLDECVFIFFDLESKVLAGILCLHVDDLLLGGCGTVKRWSWKRASQCPHLACRRACQRQER